jgi:hypothetical protein
MQVQYIRESNVAKSPLRTDATPRKDSGSNAPALASNELEMG